MQDLSFRKIKKKKKKKSGRCGLDNVIKREVIRVPLAKSYIHAYRFFDWFEVRKICFTNLYFSIALPQEDLMEAKKNILWNLLFREVHRILFLCDIGIEEIC